MPGAAYRSISNPRQYEKLRAKGFSKESAAKITNASPDRIGKSAFGVDHGEIAKAGPLAITAGLSRGARASARVRSTAAGAARAAGRRTAGTRRTARDLYVGSPIRRPGTKVHRPERFGEEPLMRELPNRRQEFVRGLAGGGTGERYMFNTRQRAQAQAATLAGRAVRHNRSAKNPATHIRAVVAGTREGLRARRMTGRQLRSAYRSTSASQRAGSRHRGAFTAGERTGRGTAWVASHPGASQAIFVTGVGGGLAGATVAADRRQAKRRAARKRAQVRKGAVMRQLVLPMAAAAAVGTGVSVGAKELDRRLYNRRGSNVSFKDSHRHPIRSGYQYKAVEHRDVARGLEDYARKQRVKAKQATDPAKVEYHRLRAARGRDVANFHHHQAHTYNAAARHGGARSAKRAGEWQRYDKTQRYKSPQTIGKSAFGIDHGEAIAKAGPPPSRRRQAVRGAEIGGSVVAGTVGSAFGAAKLRDAYKQEHSERFTRGVNRAHWTALKVGVRPARAFKLNRIATAGKPGFVPLATAVTAGSIATGARRYGSHLDRKAKKPQTEKAVAKSAFGVDHGGIEKALLKPLSAAGTVARALGKPGEAINADIAGLRAEKGFATGVAGKTAATARKTAATAAGPAAAAPAAAQAGKLMPRGVKNAVGVNGFLAQGAKAPQVAAIKNTAHESDLADKLGRFQFREPGSGTSHAAPSAGPGRGLKIGAAVTGGGAAAGAGAAATNDIQGRRKKSSVTKSAFGVAH